MPLPASSPTWPRTRPSPRPFGSACLLHGADPCGRRLSAPASAASYEQDLDVELLLDMLTGPFYFRTLFGHVSISQKNTGQIVDCILRVIKPDDVAV